MGAPMHGTTATPPSGDSTATVTSITRTTVTSTATATGGAVTVVYGIDNFYLQAQHAGPGANGMYAQVLDNYIYYR